jgi:hypothetical protein
MHSQYSLDGSKIRRLSALRTERANTIAKEGFGIDLRDVIPLHD